MAVEVADAAGGITNLQETTVKLFNRWSFDEVQVSISILFFSDVVVCYIILFPSILLLSLIFSLSLYVNNRLYKLVEVKSKEREVVLLFSFFHFACLFGVDCVHRAYLATLFSEALLLYPLACL